MWVFFHPSMTFIHHPYFQENELWDKESNHSIGSWISPQKFHNEGYLESQTASLYGRETYYDPQQTQSPVPSQQMIYLPSGYQSVRNTSQSDLRIPKEKGMMYPHLNGRNPYTLAASNNVSRYTDDWKPRQCIFLRKSFGFRYRTSRSEYHRVTDLNSVTKREIRRQLEEHFGTDLVSRRAVINAAIDRCLAEQAS